MYYWRWWIIAPLRDAAAASSGRKYLRSENCSYMSRVQDGLRLGRPTPLFMSARGNFIFQRTEEPSKRKCSAIFHSVIDFSIGRSFRGARFINLLLATRLSTDNESRCYWRRFRFATILPRIFSSSSRDISPVIRLQSDFCYFVVVGRLGT